ncbi:MAG: hypothetical protein FWF45_07710 [Coriobacteriia bacterium]|nr:hypothetical protein [Coriobacteriia bacterium]
MKKLLQILFVLGLSVSMFIGANAALFAGISIGSRVVNLGSQQKSHSFPADLSSQTATAAVAAYVREGFIKGDQVKSVQVSFDKVVDAPSTFNGTTYKEVYRYFTNYTYIKGLSSPEDIRTKYFLVALDRQKERWIIYDDISESGLAP